MLHISDDLALPVDAVTDTFAVLGKKGSGKTSALIVMLEEFFDAGVPVVSVDPKGDHYGVRSSADGKGPGLPIPVLGGRHGDIPLEPTAGAMVADLVLAERLSCVLDVSEFSRADVIRFLLAFAQRLYRQAGDEPLHLLLEECHEYLPQIVRAEEAQMVGAWQRLVKMGRFKGIGVTLASQRSAAVNKDVLEQVDNLFVLRTTGPRDREAIKRWVDTHADRAEIVDSLPTLATGEAWLWQPERGGPVRFRFRRRRTFDAGATPKVGESRRPPSTLADVDLATIKDAMAETIEKAKADDPKELRKEIAALNARIRALDARQPEPVVQVEYERVEVPVLGPDAMARLTSLLEVHDEVSRLRIDVAAVLERWSGDRQDLPRTGPASDGPGPLAGQPLPEKRPDPPVRRESRRAPVPGASEGDKLPNGPASLLGVLAARFPAWLTRRQVVTLAKRGPKSSLLGEHFAYLLDNGLIEQDRAGAYAATEAGLAITGGAVLDDPVAAWHGAFSGATQKVFDALVRVHPEPYSKDGIADLAGLSRTSSSVSAALSDLRRNGLLDESAEGIRAAGILFA